MKYWAQIKNVHDIVEEVILLKIDAVEIICFASYCPNKIEEGESYLVELTAQVFGEYDLSEIGDETSHSVEQVGENLTQVIKGRINGNRLEVGSLVFVDDVLLSDYGYLEGKMVAWKVDRIDAEFL